jgi:hypothetical protein
MMMEWKLESETGFKLLGAFGYSQPLATRSLWLLPPQLGNIPFGNRRFSPNSLIFLGYGWGRRAPWAERAFIPGREAAGLLVFPWR